MIKGVNFLVVQKTTLVFIIIHFTHPNSCNSDLSVCKGNYQNELLNEEAFCRWNQESHPHHSNAGEYSSQFFASDEFIEGIWRY